MSSSPSSSPSSFQTTHEKRSYVRALLRSLKQAGVKFLRYQAVDAGNTLRVKAVPIDYLQKSLTLDNQVAIAEVVFGGLPSFGDYMQQDSGLTASRIVQLIPDINTLRILPYAPKSAAVLCSLQDPITKQPSQLCCRSLLQRVVRQANLQYNIAFSVGSELEFCLFNDATTTAQQQQQQQPVDETNFAQSQLLNQQEPFLEALYDALQAQEIEIEQLHAESAPGQVELVLRYCDAVEMADRLVLTRETVSNVARAYGMRAVWLPKIFKDKAGNGNHLHLSVCNATTGENLFPAAAQSDNGDHCPLEAQLAQDISPTGRAFMEGILEHLPSLLGLTLPTVNSFRRVGPGCWTGSSLSWAFDDKESPLRVCPASGGTTWERVEYKLMDSMANPYLAMAAILATGTLGIAKKLELRPRSTATATIKEKLPVSLEESLDKLEANQSLQTMLSPKLLQAYLACRRAEIEHGKDNTLDDEVREALRLA